MPNDASHAAADHPVCPYCGYDLHGLLPDDPAEAFECPECGATHNAGEIRKAFRRSFVDVGWRWAMLAFSPLVVISSLLVFRELSSPAMARAVGLVTIATFAALPIHLGVLCWYAARHEPSSLRRAGTAFVMTAFFLFVNVFAALLLAGLAAGLID
jgi:hypothetical protein